MVKLGEVSARLIMVTLGCFDEVKDIVRSAVRLGKAYFK